MSIDYTSEILFKDLDEKSSLYCCCSCEVCWVDEEKCFSCGDAGELLVVPINSVENLYLPSSYGIKLSPRHMAVHQQLIDALKKQRYNNE